MKKNPRSLIHSWLLRHPFFNPFGFSLSRFFRILTSTMRTMPDFIIIGYTKSGSTALYDYLIQHPNITQAARKEIHFFDISCPNGRHQSPRLYFPKTRNDRHGPGMARHILRNPAPHRKCSPGLPVLRFHGAYQTLKYRQSAAGENKPLTKAA